MQTTLKATPTNHRGSWYVVNRRSGSAVIKCATLREAAAKARGLNHNVVLEEYRGNRDAWIIDPKARSYFATNNPDGLREVCGDD